MTPDRVIATTAAFSPRLPSERDPAQGVFGDIVVGFEAAVGGEARQRVAPLGRIAQRLGQRRLRRQLDHGLVGPTEERREQRLRLGAAPGARQWVQTAPSLRSHRTQRSDRAPPWRPVTWW